MRKKQFLLIALAIAAMLCCVGCQAGESTANSGEEPDIAQEPITSSLIGKWFMQSDGQERVAYLSFEENGFNSLTFEMNCDNGENSAHISATASVASANEAQAVVMVWHLETPVPISFVLDGQTLFVNVEMPESAESEWELFGFGEYITLSGEYKKADEPS